MGYVTASALYRDRIATDDFVLSRAFKSYAKSWLSIVVLVESKELHGDGDSGFPAGPTGNPRVWG